MRIRKPKLRRLRPVEACRCASGMFARLLRGFGKFSHRRNLRKFVEVKFRLEYLSVGRVMIFIFAAPGRELFRRQNQQQESQIV